MEIAQFLVLSAILVVLVVIYEEFWKANKEPRKAVIVPPHPHGWPTVEMVERQAEMERGTLQASAVSRPRMTSSEFSEAAREENLRLAREEAKSASQK